MKFLFPTFLIALTSIAIPIIIHFFNFRRYKTVYFSNVGFLKNIKKESKKKSRLKQILILIARILAIVFLVFAFAQPYIPTNSQSKKQANQMVAIYIDNSFSMNALSEQGLLLEIARNKAVEICLSYPAGTKFRLFTNDLEPKHQHVFNTEQFIQQVSEIKTTPKVIPISRIINRYNTQRIEENEEETDKNLYIISDFQRKISDFENLSDNTIFTFLIPLKANQLANLYIDSSWVEVPAHRLNQEENIFVRIKNNSDQDYQNLPLKLILNDSIKSITNFSVSAEKEITATLKYQNNSSGLQLGKLEITDYPFTHDNEWFISYNVLPKLKTLTIYENTPSSKEGMEYISALFSDDKYIQADIVNSQSVQISQLKNYNTIFLVNLTNFSSGFLNEIYNLAENGTSIVLFANNESNQLSNNTLLEKFGASPVIETDTTTQKISGIDFENPFFKDVFNKREENPVYPETKSHLKFKANSRTAEMNLLWFQNKDKALSKLSVNKGNLWVFSFPLNQENKSFARDILFVPTVYNIVLTSISEQEISFTIGKNTFYDIPKREELSLTSNIEIENKITGEKFVPEKSITGLGTRINFGNLISKSGHYLIQNNNKTIASLAFNYDRDESDLSHFTNEEIANLLRDSKWENVRLISNVTTDFSEILDELQNGKQLWKWFILMALFFILAEVTISRFMK